LAARGAVRTGGLYRHLLTQAYPPGANVDHTTYFHITNHVRYLWLGPSRRLAGASNPLVPSSGRARDTLRRGKTLAIIGGTYAIWLSPSSCCSAPPAKRVGTYK
jgi:hypothetical protein